MSFSSLLSNGELLLKKAACWLLPLFPVASLLGSGLNYARRVQHWGPWFAACACCKQVRSASEFVLFHFHSSLSSLMQQKSLCLLVIVGNGSREAALWSCKYATHLPNQSVKIFNLNHTVCPLHNLRISGLAKACNFAGSIFTCTITLPGANKHCRTSMYDHKHPVMDICIRTKVM